MRVFVNNADSYLGHALLQDLKALPSPPEVVGTLTNDGLEAEVDVPARLDALVSRKDAAVHRETILSSNAVVFDLHSGNISEAEGVVSLLEHAQLTHPVSLVLVSSVLTWARTPVTREEVEEVEVSDQQPQDLPEGEAPPKPTRPAVLEATSWRTRVPPASHQRWRSLESLVLKMRNPNVRATVLGCGALYGLGEISGHFAEMLHAAYFRDEETLASLVSHPGNFLPTVHVADAARVVTHAIGNPELAGNFILAVDRGQHTQLEIAAAFAKFAGAFDLHLKKSQSSSQPAISRPWGWGEVDLRLAPSAPVTYAEFRGRATQGLVASVQLVVAEYTRARKLQPIRVAVVGPPCVGKSTVAAALAEKLHLPLVTLGPLVKAAVEAGERVRAALASETKKAEDLTESEKFALAVADELKASATPKVPGRLSPASIGKLVRRELIGNFLCASRGWILDGFPRSAAEARALWVAPSPTVAVAPAEGARAEADAAADPAAEAQASEAAAAAAAAAAAEAEAETVAREVARVGGVQEVVVLSLEAATAKCQERSVSVAGTFAKGTSHHYSKEEFTRRSNRYKAEQSASDAAVVGFFAEGGTKKLATLEVSSKDAREAAELAIAALETSGVEVKYFENKGKVKDDPEEAERRTKEDEQRRKEEQRRVEEELKRKTEEAERRRREADDEENKKKENETKIRDIAVKEEELLEKQSRHLREYLERDVLPTLTAGILEICNELPEDPIDFLAEYLFAHSQTLLNSSKTADS